MEVFSPRQFISQKGLSALLAVAACFLVAPEPGAAAAGELVCGREMALVSGVPDSTLFAIEASAGIRAFWCERYDEFGTATRIGPYREIYSDGQLRVTATYVDSKLAGAVAIRYQDGSLFMRGFLADAEWTGSVEIYHPSGATWFEATFDSGRLEGRLRTRYADGALESETRFQAGYEDGLARSFYSTAAGGRLKSEARIEADQIVGLHRLLNREGDVVRTIDWSDGPPAWRPIQLEATVEESDPMRDPSSFAIESRRQRDTLAP